MTAPTPSVCRQKLALLNAYEEAARLYSEGLTRIKSQIAILPQTEYDAAYRSVEILRMDARIAQENLDQHVSSHGC
jgi:hypothetical protein